jgi:hypothetical protein
MYITISYLLSLIISKNESRVILYILENPNAVTEQVLYLPVKNPNSPNDWPFFNTLSSFLLTSSNKTTSPLWITNKEPSSTRSCCKSKSIYYNYRQYFVFWTISYWFHGTYQFPLCIFREIFGNDLTTFQCFIQYLKK